MNMSNPMCRCGWDGKGVHLCHRCGKKPGSERFVATGPASLAGVQVKFSAYKTWGCEECWKEYAIKNAQSTNPQ